MFSLRRSVRLFFNKNYEQFFISTRSMHVKSRKQNISCFPCKGFGADVSSICLVSIRLCFANTRYELTADLKILNFYVDIFYLTFHFTLGETSKHILAKCLACKTRKMDPNIISCQLRVSRTRLHLRFHFLFFTGADRGCHERWNIPL